MPRELTFRLFNRIEGNLPSKADAREKFALPIPVEVRDLGKGLAGMASLHFPRYTEFISSALAIRDLDPARFRTMRAFVEYPPVGSAGFFKLTLADL